MHDGCCAELVMIASDIAIYRSLLSRHVALCKFAFIAVLIGRCQSM